MSTKRELVTKVFHNEPTERIPELFTHHYLEEGVDDYNGGLKILLCLIKILPELLSLKRNLILIL